MSVTAIFIAVWLCGFIFLVGRSMNFMRLVFNNVLPGKDCSAGFMKYFNFRFRFMDATMIDPESLTESGRAYQKQSVRNDRVLMVWLVAGIIIACSSSYFAG